MEEKERETQIKTDIRETKTRVADDADTQRDEKKAIVIGRQRERQRYI